MELMGGVMIMLLLLALLFSAVWLSLPILIVGLWRRMERVAMHLEQVETRIASLEHRLDTQAAQRITTQDMTISTVIEEGGIDGTA